MSPRRVAAGLALLVAVLDVLQVVLLSWRPKHWGALAGALVYAVLAVAVRRGARWATVVVALVPLLPVSILALTALGVGLPVAPDAAMVGILAVQLGAAGASVAALRTEVP